MNLDQNLPALKVIAASLAMSIVSMEDLEAQIHAQIDVLDPPINNDFDGFGFSITAAEPFVQDTPASIVPDDAPAWQKREAAKVAANPLGWKLDPIPGHFAHRSKNDANRVAYTKSAAYGEQDRQTATDADAYLTKYYPNLSSADRDDAIEANEV